MITIDSTSLYGPLLITSLLNTSQHKGGMIIMINLGQIRQRLDKISFMTVLYANLQIADGLKVLHTIKRRQKDQTNVERNRKQLL